MDLATLIGLIVGAAVVLVAILLGSALDAFVNVPGIMIVFGGTLSAVLIRFPILQFLGSFRIALKAFKSRLERPQTIVKKSVSLAQIVRREGLLALEDQDVSDPFFAKGLRLCVDGLEPGFVRKVLTEDLDRTLERHETGQRIFRAIGTSAPALGMIGTLIGLVQLLGNMHEPGKVGPAMAVALLTTLYGALIAHMFAIPVADKLELRSGQERMNKTLVIEAIMCIQEGRNPRILEELLLSYLPPSSSPTSPDATPDTEPRYPRVL